MKLGVVCCDAGATNQLLAYLKSKNLDNLIGYFSGPAKKIYPEFVPNIRLVDNIEEVVSSCDELFTGTGWSSDIEHDARVLAAQKGVFSTAAIDHWVNYYDRFKRLSNTQLPNRIFVFDQTAYIKASTVFNHTEIILLEPYYKNYILHKISRIKPSRSSILYICEPFRQPSKSILSLEEELLLKFLTKLDDKYKNSFSKITVRLHPSETYDKYDHILKRFEHLNISIDMGELAVSIGRSTTVVGCSSYALYLAHHSGRKIISNVEDYATHNIFNMENIIPMERL